MFALVTLCWVHCLGVEEILRFSLIETMLYSLVFQECRFPFSFVLTEVAIETLSLVVKTFQVHSEISSIIRAVITILFATVENLRPGVL